MFDKPTKLTLVLIVACVVLYIPELIGLNLNAWLAVSPYSATGMP